MGNNKVLSLNSLILSVSKGGWGNKGNLGKSGEIIKLGIYISGGENVSE